MLEITIYILTGFIDFLLLIKFIEIFLQPKFPYKQQLRLFKLTFLSLITINLINYLINIPSLSFLYILISVIFILKYYKGLFKIKIMYIIIEPILLGVIGFIIKKGLYVFLGPPYSLKYGNQIYKYLSVFSMYITLYIVINFIEIFKNKRNSNYKNPYNKSIFSIILLNVLFLISIVSYYHVADFSQESFETLILITIVGVMLSIFFSVILYNTLLTHLQQEYNTRLQLQLNELQRDYYDKINTSSKALKSLRHDLKNHLIVINGYLCKNKILEARTYVNEITELIKDSNTIINTDNIVLSSVLTNKKALCEEKNISFNHNINLGRQIINDSDLCIIISNILDNAIEASEQLPDNKGFIDLDIDDSNELLSITCTNNYIQEPIIKKGRFLSSKEKSIFHGIGLLNVEHIVNKYDGVLNVHFEENIFYIDVLLKF